MVRRSEWWILRIPYPALRTCYRHCGDIPSKTVQADIELAAVPFIRAGEGTQTLHKRADLVVFKLPESLYQREVETVEAWLHREMGSGSVRRRCVAGCNT